MGVPYAIVDAFAERPFTGNPAAVVLLDKPREPDWMLSIARETNLSETAFVVQRTLGEYDLRWFTPAVEVPLCGHATLASAHFLWTQDVVPKDRALRFHTASGPLVARFESPWIELDLPAIPAEEREAPEALASALGASPIRTGKSAEDWLAEFADEAAVRALRPDFARITALGGQGVIATARSANDRADFVSRYFAPAVGIDEDPVTGAAHCTLSPWWSARLGRKRLVGYQASRRGGFVRVEHRDDRVTVAGGAATIALGMLQV